MKTDLSILLVPLVASVALAGLGDDGTHAHATDLPPSEEQAAFEAALATGHRLDLSPERRWRWLVASTSRMAWDGDRLRPVSPLPPGLRPFIGMATLSAFSPSDETSPIDRIARPRNDYVPFDDDPPALEPATPRRAPESDQRREYTPFESRNSPPRDWDAAICDDYVPFDEHDGDDAGPAAEVTDPPPLVPEPSQTTGSNTDCDDQWTTLRPPADDGCVLESWQPVASDLPLMHGATLRHPVDRTLRDVALDVAGQRYTLAAGTPVIAQPVQLGAAGAGVELTAVGPAIDPFGPLESFERVYVLADQDPERLRRRAAFVLEALCAPALDCAAHAFPLRGVRTVSSALVAVRPRGEGHLSVAGWTYQLEAR